MTERIFEVPQAVRWDDGRLFLLDQTQLPDRIVEEQQETIEQVWQSIRQLKVRGAPAIGVAGAYGLVVAMRSRTGLCPERFLEHLRERADYLATARPTAVNLRWALDRLLTTADDGAKTDAPCILANLEQEAVAIHRQDMELCRQIGLHGMPLIREGTGVLTHCNAGALATSSLGTATAPMYMAHERGVRFSVFSDETRPLLQGARLTTWELQRAGIDVTLICDAAAAHMMDTGRIDLVIVGTDRVAANGDVANKIGTLSVAIAARHFGIPFYVACPCSTVDMKTPSGDRIVIEQRDEREVTGFAGRRAAPQDVKANNPAFDVTPAALLTGLITERGILRPPFDAALRQAYAEHCGAVAERDGG